MLIWDSQPKSYQKWHEIIPHRITQKRVPSSAISSATECQTSAIFYEIYESIISFMWGGISANEVFMRFYRVLKRFMEIYEKRLQITIPSFIFYVSPSKNALFKPFVISAYCTECHAGHHLSIMT